MTMTDYLEMLLEIRLSFVGLKLSLRLQQRLANFDRWFRETLRAENAKLIAEKKRRQGKP
jgi:hypothetical protein